LSLDSLCQVIMQHFTDNTWRRLIFQAIRYWYMFALFDQIIVIKPSTYIYRYMLNIITLHKLSNDKPSTYIYRYMLNILLPMWKTHAWQHHFTKRGDLDQWNYFSPCHIFKCLYRARQVSWHKYVLRRIYFENISSTC
jgi:hypothetical protein